jgi:hypothetical protein
LNVLSWCAFLAAERLRKNRQRKALGKGANIRQNADVFFATNDLIPGRLAKLLLKPELRNIPINLVLSALVFFGWMICVVFDLSILRFFPLAYLRYPLSLLIAGLALG